MQWLAAPETLSIDEGVVHVWRAPLDPPEMTVARLAETLSEDERQRANRFVFERDRRRFTVARGVLRSLLARYLGSSPDRLRFSYGPFGKPGLAEGSGTGPLCFNASHSGDLALYAVTVGREVGVDVERIRSNFALEQVAERFFSPREVAALRDLAPENRPLGFFNCWTRKEAYIKARGAGLSLPLDRFDVSLAPGEPAALLTTLDDPGEASRWSLRALSLESGTVAALAVTAPLGELRCWQWTGK